MTLVTCGLTACRPGSAPGPTFGNEYEKLLELSCRRRRAVIVWWLFSQDQICDMYQQLYDNGHHVQLKQLEEILVSVIKDVRKQQCENDRLERSYQRSEAQAFV